jgi:hypothetical protein
LVPFGQVVSEEKIKRLILFSDWLMLKKSSPLKQLGQMESNLARSIYVRSKPGIDGPCVCPFQNFLPSLAPFCQAVSEEKIFLNSSQSETRIALGGHICWWNGTKWRNFIACVSKHIFKKLFFTLHFNGKIENGTKIG